MEHSCRQVAFWENLSWALLTPPSPTEITATTNEPEVIDTVAIRTA